MNFLKINALIQKSTLNKKPFNLSDDHTQGLQLRVSATGNAVWWVRKRINYKLVQLKLGNYPEVSLKEAREKAKNFLGQKHEKVSSFTVRDAFNCWYVKISKQLITHKGIYLRCHKHILKKFGNWQFKELKAIDLITAWQPLYDEGHTETIHKLCSYIRKMQAFSINTGRIDTMHDLSHIRENYVFKKPVNHVTVDDGELKYIFKAFSMNQNVTNLSFYLFLMTNFTLLRIGEVVKLKWSYIDLDEKIIHIPAFVMKMKRPHQIPISSQLENLLKSLPKISDYVFPSRTKNDDHCSNETLRIYLKKIGLQGIQTAHGLRAMGRTFLAKKGMESYLAEMCLHHKVGSNVENVYRRYDYLEERRGWMQKWCDFVEMAKNEALAISDDEYKQWYSDIKEKCL